MWGNGKKSKSATIDTLVGSHTEVRGDIYFSGGLHVDGVVKGSVVAAGDNFSLLVLAESGRIEGEVQVPNVSINGTVVGDIHAMEHVELVENAKVSGNIHYTLIEMASGAQVNGQLIQQPKPDSDVQARPDKNTDANLAAANDGDEVVRGQENLSKGSRKAL